MIWKAVIGTDPILLRGRSYTRGAPIQVTALGSIALSPTYIDGRCRDLHRHPVPKFTRPRKKTPKTPGPLSWLRTNRQINTEAQPIVYTNLHLHICDALVFSAFLSLQPPESILRPSTIRSLSFCLKIKIQSDFRDGFSFARGVDHGAHGWGTSYLGTGCLCPSCFALWGLKTDVTDQLSARELRLRVYFTCRQGQGNERPVIGQLADGRLRKGRLYRPKDPTPLVWVDNDGGSIEELVEHLCDEMPLRIFSGGGGKMESVDVRFCTERIEHDSRNECPHPRDRCWCIGRSIDEETLPRIALVREIERRLTGGRAIVR